MKDTMHDIRYQISSNMHSYTDQRDVVFMAKGLMNCLNQVSKEVKDHSVQPDSSNDLVSHSESHLKIKTLKMDGKYMDTLKDYVDKVKSEPIRNM